MMENVINFDEYLRKSKNIIKCLFKTIIGEQKKFNKCLDKDNFPDTLIENMDLIPFNQIADSFGLLTEAERELLWEDIDKLIEVQDNNLNCEIERFVNKYI